jgi:hypothetical protein
MFDHLCVMNTLELGELAERLLFYDEITMYVDEEGINFLFFQEHPNLLIPFLEEYRDKVRLRCTVFNTGVYNENRYDAEIMRANEWLVGDKTFYEYIYESNNLETPDGYIKDKDLARRFLDLLKIDHLDDSVWHSIFDDNMAKNELPNFIRQYVADNYPNTYDLLPEDMSFAITDRDSLSFKLHADFDPWPVNKAFRKQGIRLNILRLASSYISFITDFPVWLELESDLQTAPLGATIVRSKINRLLSKQGKSLEVINNFQDIFLAGKNIEAVINSKERSFKDFIEIYEKGERFRAWIRDVPPDSNLMQEYYNSVTSNTWLERLPTKIARWSLFTGAGLGIDALGGGGVGTAAGLLLGTFDTFVLDKLLHGWKPNQFIDGTVKKFVEG